MYCIIITNKKQYSNTILEMCLSMDSNDGMRMILMLTSQTIVTYTMRALMKR